MVVEATQARVATRPSYLDISGTLASARQARIVTTVAGRVVSLEFGSGQRVTKGQVLARLDATSARAALKAAEGAQRNANQVFQNDEKLLPLGGVSSEQALNDASLLDAAEAKLAEAKQQLAAFEIRAPFSGLLGFSEAAVGAFLSAGDALTEIQQVDPLLVQTSVPQVDVERLKNGLPVEVSVPGIAARYSGEVVAIAPSLDPVRHAMRIQIRVPNDDGRLKPGMYVTLRVAEVSVDRVVLVPEQALAPEAGHDFVWIVDAHKRARRMAVTLGQYRNGEVEVVSGLPPAALVVTAGMQKLHDGSTVTVTPYHPVRNPELKAIGGAAGTGD